MVYEELDDATVAYISCIIFVLIMQIKCVDWLTFSGNNTTI